MSNQETGKKALEYAARVLAPRMLSENQLREKMRAKEYEEADIDYAVGRLKEMNAVNDAEYAAMIARHYAGRGFGRQKVIQELRRKGVPKEIAEEAAAGFQPCSEQVIRYLEKTIKEDKKDKRVLRKAANGLYRRGFSWEQIDAALDVYCNTEEDETCQ